MCPIEPLGIADKGGSILMLGWSQDQPDLEKKSLFINFLNFMIFLPSQEICFHPTFFFRPNIIKICIKFDSKLSCRLRQLFHLIIFFN